jgi:hypothetical protein
LFPRLLAALQSKTKQAYIYTVIKQNSARTGEMDRIETTSKCTEAREANRRASRRRSAVVARGAKERASSEGEEYI